VTRHVETDVSDYEGFDPVGKQSSWKLDQKSADYAHKHFNDYIEDKIIREMMVDTPLPDHGTFATEELDAQTANAIKKAFPKSWPDKIKSRDTRLKKRTRKTTTCGPVRPFVGCFNKARRSSKDAKMDVKEALQLTEKTVLLVGQANVAIKHTRRSEILTPFTGSANRTLDLLKTYKKLLTSNYYTTCLGRSSKKKMKKNRERILIKRAF
jgi:hypothetical protein